MTPPKTWDCTRPACGVLHRSLLIEALHAGRVRPQAFSLFQGVFNDDINDSSGESREDRQFKSFIVHGQQRLWAFTRSQIRSAKIYDGAVPFRVVPDGAAESSASRLANLPLTYTCEKKYEIACREK